MFGEGLLSCSFPGRSHVFMTQLHQKRFTCGPSLGGKGNCSEGGEDSCFFEMLQRGGSTIAPRGDLRFPLALKGINQSDYLLILERQLSEILRDAGCSFARFRKARSGILVDLCFVGDCKHDHTEVSGFLEEEVTEEIDQVEDRRSFL